MNEKPILFNTEMVKAILEGRKTQTRRVVTQGKKFHQPPTSNAIPDMHEYGNIHCPYGNTDDYLWVRETWRAEELGDDRNNPGLDGIRYRADNAFIEINNTQEASHRWLDARGDHGDKWRPSIFMPRWASRITLEIIDVRVERVQDASIADLIAEGCPEEYWPENCGGFGHAVSGWFEHLWDTINVSYTWQSNPWVWVVEFEMRK